MVRPQILQSRRKLGVSLSQQRDLMKESRVPGSSIPILHPKRNPRSPSGLHSRMIRGVQAPKRTICSHTNTARCKSIPSFPYLDNSHMQVINST